MVEDHKDMMHWADLQIKDQRKHAVITGLENGAYCKKEALSVISRELAATFSEPWADAVKRDVAMFGPSSGEMPVNRCQYCGTRHTMKQTVCQNCGGPT